MVQSSAHTHLESVREDQIVLFEEQSTSVEAISLDVQHAILTSLQGILEQCMFEFATKWIPEVLGDERLDYAEALELNKGTTLLMNSWDKIPPGAILPPLTQ